MNESTILFGILAAVFVGLVAIWRELRVLSHAARAKNSTERVVLPMSTNVCVMPTQSAQLTGRPEVHFRPTRVCISNAGTGGGAADWIVNDIKIAGKSVFIQCGDVPGDMFSTNTIDDLVSFPIAEPGQSVVIVATYIGTNAKGAPFFASVIGTHAPQKQSRANRRKAALVNASATN